MTAAITTVPGSEISVGTLVAIGVGLTVLTAGVGRLRIALLLALPTLLLAGAAGILSWLTGGVSRGTADPERLEQGTSGVFSTTPAVAGADASDGFPWSTLLLALLGIVLTLVAGLGAAVRARRGASGDGITDFHGPPGAGFTYPDLAVGLDVDLGVEDERAKRPEPPTSRGRPRSMDGLPRERTGATSSNIPERWDHARYDRLAARMDVMRREFLRCVVPRPGRPARVDLLSPRSQWFTEAFSAAADLLVGVSQTDHPDRLAGAVREAERRWRIILRTPAEGADGSKTDGGRPSPAPDGIAGEHPTGETAGHDGTDPDPAPEQQL